MPYREQSSRGELNIARANSTDRSHQCRLGRAVVPYELDVQKSQTAGYILGDLELVQGHLDRLEKWKAMALDLQALVVLGHLMQKAD